MSDKHFQIFKAAVTFIKTTQTPYFNITEGGTCTVVAIPYSKVSLTPLQIWENFNFNTVCGDVRHFTSTQVHCRKQNSQEIINTLQLDHLYCIVSDIYKLSDVQQMVSRWAEYGQIGHCAMTAYTGPRNRSCSCVRAVVRLDKHCKKSPDGPADSNVHHNKSLHSHSLPRMSARNLLKVWWSVKWGMTHGTQNEILEYVYSRSM